MRNGADNWWAFALSDLKMARIALKEGLYNQVCFHSQQAVEKALKTVIVAQDKTPERTHSVAKLLNLLPALFEPEFAQELLLLDQVYLPTRYPDALPGTLSRWRTLEGPGREVLGTCRCRDKPDRAIFEGKTRTRRAGIYALMDETWLRWREPATGASGALRIATVKQWTTSGPTILTRKPRRATVHAP